MLILGRRGYLSFTGTATVNIVKTVERIIFAVQTLCIHFLTYPYSSGVDYRAVGTYEKGDHDHRTGRKCARCDGALHDSIINFGEMLPEKALNLAREHADKADLCLVLGSSLTVPPACTIPETVGKRKGAQLAICNLQKTGLDGFTDVRVFAESDVLMTRVMEKLGYPIPPFILRRRLVIQVETHEEDRHRVTATGVDSDGTPVSFLQSVKLEGSRRIARAEPFVIHVRDTLQPGMQLKLGLEFMGHYNEPNLELAHDYNGSEEITYLLEFNPQNGRWGIKRLDDLAEATESLSLEPTGTAEYPITLD